MRQLCVVAIFALLVLENYVVAQSGTGCLRPTKEQLPQLIEDYYSKELGIELTGVELTGESLHVCTSESMLNRTVMVVFACDVCGGTMVAALYDMECSPGEGWEILSNETLEAFDETIGEYANCSYCLNDSMRIELFPSYPSNSYQYPPDSHCLYLPNCYTDTVCSSTVLEKEEDLDIETARDCCAGTNSGLAYQLNGDCHVCKVHGFPQAYYSVSEGETLTTALKKYAQGPTGTRNPDLKGYIKSVGAELGDYEPVNVTVTRRNGIQSLTVDIYDDNVTLEEDRFCLLYNPDEDIKDVLESVGEFLRDKATIIIEDHGVVEIKPSKLMYSFNEADNETNLCFKITTNTEDTVCPVEFNVSVVLNITRVKDAPDSDDADEENHTIRTACADVNFTACESEVCVDLKREFGIEDDNETHLNQLFNFTLIPNTLKPFRESITVNDTTGEACIKEDDNATIKMEHTEYNVTEAEGSVKVCVIFANPHPHLPVNDPDTCYLDFQFQLIFKTMGGTADPYTDYVPQGEVPGSGVQVFEKCAIRYCRPVEILVDEEEEGTEEFLVSIEVYNHNGNMPPVEVLDGYSRAIIKIQPEPEPTPTPTSSPSPSPSPRPEPKIQCELFETTLTATEGGSVTVCVSAAVIPVEFESGFMFHVELTTTEIGAGGPYILQLNNTETLVCQDIPVHDDCTMNLPRRTFNVTLTSLDESVAECVATAVVTVNDDPNIVVEFEQAKYSVIESDAHGNDNIFGVCFVVASDCECPIDFNVYLSVSSGAFVSPPDSYSAATSPEDYGAVSVVVHLDACANRNCTNFTIVNDGTVEDDEAFFATLEITPGLDSRIKLTGRAKTNIIIKDRNSATVSLKEAMYMINEGDSKIRNVCVLISAENMNRPVAFDFSVNITSDNGCIMDKQFNVAKNVNTACIDIQLSVVMMDDDLINGDRSLCHIHLVTNPELEDRRIIIDLKRSDVVIKYNDSGLVGIVVREPVVEAIKTEVCLEFLPPVSCEQYNISFEATFMYGAGTEASLTDYSTIAFNPEKCPADSCTEIEIENNERLEKRFLFLRLVNTSMPALVGVDSRIKNFSIVDDDFVVVKFESMDYYVSEEDGSVDVCFVLDFQSGDAGCPVAFEFKVNITTEDNSAKAGMDYNSTSEIITYDQCNSDKKCLNIPILKDDVEDQDESFFVVLSLLMECDGLSVGPKAAVNIDSNVVGFDMTVYEVCEADEVVIVCAVVVAPLGPCPFDEFEVQLISEDGTAIAEKDYVAVNEILTFGMCQKEACTEIVIMNDNIARKNRYFNLSLSQSTNEEIILTPNVARVEIIDKTTVEVRFEKSYYPVNETTVGGVELCVVVKDKEIEIDGNLFPFQVNLTTIDGSAKSGKDFYGVSDYVLSINETGKACVCIKMNEDGRLEGQEDFEATIERNFALPDLVELIVTKAYVTIQDMAGDASVATDGVPVTVYESEGNVEICAEVAANPSDTKIDVNCTVEPSFNLSVSATDGTADSVDYTLVDPVMVFSACDTRACVKVIISAEYVLEDEKQTFEVLLSKSDSLLAVPSLSEKINIDTEKVTVIIKDDTPHTTTLSLVEELYLVNEKEIKSLTVCVEMTYAVEFQFEVDLEVKDLYGNELTPVTITFPGDHNTFTECGVVAIEIDVEKGTVEKYTISLRRHAGLDRRIMLDEEGAEVIVTDEDESAAGCYSSSDCSNDTLITYTGSPERCCVDIDTSVAYKTEDGNCRSCIVHGFTQKIYQVTEGLTVPVEFREGVKGTSDFTSVKLALVGTISSEAAGASECDYECTGEVETNYDGITVVPFVSINDDLSLEYNDKVKMIFTPYYERYIDELREKGEFVRTSAFVDIRDNDDLEINFEQMRFVVEEGGKIELDDIKFQHQKTEGSFDIILESISLEEFHMMRGGMRGGGGMPGEMCRRPGGMRGGTDSELDGGMDMGSGMDDFIGDFRDRFPDFCNATKGDDFAEKSVTLCVDSSTDPGQCSYQNEDAVITVDDDINENTQVFVLLARVETNMRLKESSVCFTRTDKDCGPCMRRGVALIFITDDDPMVIGFSERQNSADEPPMDSIFNIEIVSNIESEINHIVQIDLVKPKSNATVTVDNDSDTDVVFGDYSDAYAIGTHVEMSNQLSVSISVDVLADSRGEGVECFTLRISAPDSEKRRDIFTCNKGENANDHFCYFTLCIDDMAADNPCTIGFSSDKYSAPEYGSAAVCVESTCPANTINMVEVEVFSIDSNAPQPLAIGAYPFIDCSYEYKVLDDYEKQIHGCNKLLGMIISQNEATCYDQTFNNDERLEATEYTGIRLHIKEATSYTKIERETSVIEIVNDDIAVVGLEQVEYTVEEEDGMIEVCVKVLSPDIDCPVDFSFEVKFFTVDVTADSQDYTPVEEKLLFTPCQKRSCISITIKDDCYLDKVIEGFDIMLDRTADLSMNITLDPMQGTVEIHDYVDRATVKLIYTEDTVTEGARFNPAVCAIVEGCGFNNPVLFPFEISLFTESKTAIYNEDFVPLNTIAMFTPGNVALCVDVIIIDDETVEPLEEYFFVRLERTSGLDYRIQLEDTVENITIIDDDVALFSLEDVYCKVFENATEIEVCAENVDGIMCPVSFGFNLLFSIDSDSASSGDYTGSDPITVPFPACSMGECIKIPIINDDILEYRERFTVSLERPADVDTRIKLVYPTLKIVDIVDEDKIVIDFTGPTIVVEENNGKIQVCLTVVKGHLNCPSAKPFELIVFTVEGTAKPQEDYVSNATTLTFDPCDDQECLDIEILNDLRVEQQEQFNVSVVRSPGLNKRIKLANTERTIRIIDTDMIQLKFMTTYHEVEEGDSVGICVEMEDPVDTVCPYDGQFDVSISTDDRSAVAPGDYMLQDPTLTFDACDTIKCFIVQIVDDCILEDDETFIVKMTSTSMPGRIKVNSADVVTVNITDNDYLFVGLKHQKVEVYENEGPAQVCAFIQGDCYPSFLFRIHIFTEDDSADDPTGDYEPVENGVLMFTPTDNEPCLSVMIIDDKEVEQDESFDVVLERTPGLNERVKLLPGQSRAEVIIKNEDNATLNFERSRVFVREEGGPARVCVAVTDPTGLDCPVAYPIDLLIIVTHGTAFNNIDYVAPPVLLRFEACSARECVDIGIIDDKVLEENENFTVTFMLDSGASKDILLGDTTTAVVIILDFDELMIGFVQTAYTVDEDENMVAVCAEVEGANGNCLATFPFDIGFETIRGSAVEDDDFVPVSGAVLHFGPCDNVQCTVVEIVDDCVLEETEQFNLLLSEIPGQNDRVKVGAGDSEIEITDDDGVRVGLEFASYGADEDVGTQQVCVVIKPETCPSSELFRVSLSTVDDSADSADGDYVSMSRTLVFAPFSFSQCVPIVIRDDDKLEQTEAFRVTLELIDDLSGRVQLDGSLATVAIFNDDTADIRLEMMNYRIDEDDGPVELCVEIVSPDITCPVAFPFDLVFITSDITAVSGQDYRPPINNLRFGMCEKKECFPIEIINDNLIEETESFNVTLEKSTGLSRFFNILENSRVETVSIIDNDLAVVGFAQTAYTVSERNTAVRVCVNVFSPAISCPVDTPFTIGIIVVEQTADNPEDYVAANFIPLEFSRCQRSACTSDIDIVDDLIVEESETINLILRNPDPTLIDLDPSNSVIIITDSSDRAYVELEESVYLATEGMGAVTVCAIIDRPVIACPVDFNFEVTLSVGDDDLPIVFTTCATRACIAVLIIDDDRVEDETEIRIRLERPTDLDSRISVDTSYSIIRITDDPDDSAVVGLESINYSYSEDASQPEVCLVVTSPSVQCPICTDFTVMMESTDITADSPQDYRSISTQVAFNNDCDRDNCEVKKCVRIYIVNDRITENIERFRVTLSRTAGMDSRITLAPNEGQVTILDNDMAQIQMQRTSITVREDVGTVAVCVDLSSSGTNCPVEYDFTIILLTISDSAGNGMDYTGFSKTVEFEACDSRKCVDVEIIDNCELEDTEEFYVTLLRNGLDLDDVEVVNSRTTIEITDGDVVNVGMEETEYAVDEDAGQITVCVAVEDDCVIPFQFHVKLRTVERSGGADESDDYTVVETTLRFAGNQGRACVAVPIVNDGEVEGDETFYISLSEDPNNPLDSRISLNPNRATVTIIDDDAVNVRLEFGTYQTSEDGLTAFVCAVMRSPDPLNTCPINGPVSVTLISTDGTAVRGQDYNRVSTTLMFDACDLISSCYTVSAIDDQVLEAPRETFSVSLDRGTDTRIRVNQIPATVSISDNDDVDIRLVSSTYTVTEASGATVEVCVEEFGSTSIGVPVTVRLSTQSGTATAPSDYDSLANAPLIFQPGNTRVCVSVTINDDSMLEETEAFTVTLTTQDSRVHLQRTTATITILDTDQVMLSFLSMSRRVSENAGTVNNFVCIDISGGSGCPASFSFEVELSTSGSAVEGNDYVGIADMVTVSRCQSQLCVPVTIIDDSVVENEENLVITISTDAQRVSVDRNADTAELIIDDNDNAMVRLEHVYQIAQENNNEAEICAILIGPASVSFPFEVTFDFSEGTATTPEDFTVTQNEATFQPGSNEACVTITLANSPNLEMPQSLYVSIQLVGGNGRITLAQQQSNGEIVIEDDDEATVGLENTVYRMNADADSVSVCVRISFPPPNTPIPGVSDCPITFPFDLIFRLSSTSAGVFEVNERGQSTDGGIRPSDDSDLDVILEFNSCQRKFCFDMKVKAGATLESLSAPEYMISIARTPDHGRTTILDATKTVGRIEVH